MGTKKGGARKGKPAGSRKAFDDTKDSKKRPSAASTRRKGITTKKGMAREGTVAGSRLAYDDTPDIIGKKQKKGMVNKRRSKKKGKYSSRKSLFPDTQDREVRTDNAILRLIDATLPPDLLAHQIITLIFRKYR